MRRADYQGSQELVFGPAVVRATDASNSGYCQVMYLVVSACGVREGLIDIYVVPMQALSTYSEP